MGNQFLERVTSIKSLGVTLRNDLKWNDRVNIITSKASKRLHLLKQLKRADVAKLELVKFYCSCIRFWNIRASLFTVPYHNILLRTLNKYKNEL